LFGEKFSGPFSEMKNGRNLDTALRNTDECLKESDMSENSTFKFRIGLSHLLSALKSYQQARAIDGAHSFPSSGSLWFENDYITSMNLKKVRIP
jgi:hypothetical protein